ncbi:MAG TPA: hypothetical protein VFF73_21135, partial [Planctomycetota bacterium]|nr:hypothetical protein [Planctomycetota bacterium]
DGLLNNTDFGTKVADTYQRNVQLYSSGPLVRVGSGRDNNSPSGMPPLSDDNTTIVDSAENFFNAEPALAPRTSRDIVWLVNSGKASDEVVFDDYLDRNMFIFAPMTVSTWIDSTGKLHVADGFKNDGTAPGDFGQPVSVQNAACSPPGYWNIPAAGNLEPTTPGTGRIEPVALGGVSGKGFYLAGSSRLVFDVPTQPAGQDPASYSWYAGVFLNPSFSNDGTRRELLSFPDGTGVDLLGTSTLVLHDANDAIVAQYALGALAPVSGQWTHLGFVVEDGGTTVTVVLNGFRWQRWTGSAPLLQLAPLPGAVTLGGRSGKAGISGWVDELKVASEAPPTEILANHARGTIVQLGPNYTGPLLTLAQSYPAWAQQQVNSELGQTGQTYVCYTGYATELGASHREAPSGTISVRSQLDFPEQQMNASLPRNDSTKNVFCLTCHGAPGASRPSLTTFALQPGTLPEAQDPVRRPIQPPRLMYGLIPQDFFGPGQPASATWNDAGVPVDDYLLPGH